MVIKIRFNTDSLKFPEQNLPEWRVLYGNREYLAKFIKVQAPSWTSKDLIETGETKWHITTEGNPFWNEEMTILSIEK